MRYLYGDSVPFPSQYDFLAALEAFCTQAGRVARLDTEVRELRKTTEEAGAIRAHALEELRSFHREAVGALHEGAKESVEPLVHDYVRQLGELALRLVDEAGRTTTQAGDREAAQTRAECDRRRVEVRDALEKMLVAVRLPVSETEVAMSLVDGRCQCSATFSHDGGLVASFTLSADEHPEWQAPRHVKDLAQNVTLPVGVKRSLFKRTVAPEIIVLDDYVISGFDLRDDRADIHLRRKPEHADSLVFSLKRIEERLIAEVHYPGDAEAESGLPAVLDQTSAVEVERLWQLLRAGCGPLLAKKKRLVTLTLSGEDVFAMDLGTPVVALVVGVIAPIVAEVSRRSPNAHELSLKVENDAGRREEIYLRKAQVVSALASVPPKARRVFDPLGLIASDPRESMESINEDGLIRG